MPSNLKFEGRVLLLVCDKGKEIALSRATPTTDFYVSMELNIKNDPAIL